MKSPFFKTLLMGIIAAVTSLIASYFYPWPAPVVQNALVGKPLFEAYDASAVRSISIVKYDTDRNGLERIELRRSGEKWIIPARKNFVATNATQISLAVNSLNCNVLATESSDQQDHVEYGVVDPLEYESTPNRSSLGTKIVLEDRNNRELGSLIVGDSPRDAANSGQQKHFVRVPGQPNVYVVEISSTALSTGFTHWVSSNLLQLSQGQPIASITIDNYRLPADQPTAENKAWIYSTQIDVQKQKRELRIPQGDDQQLADIEPTPELVRSFQNLGNFIGNIRFTDVQKKAPAIAKQLSKRSPEESPDLAGLNQYGFEVAGLDSKTDFGLKFNSVGGEVIVRTTDGVAISVLIGSLVENPTAGNLNYNVMLYASVVESMFPLPEKLTASDDTATAEKAEKVYLRAVEARKTKIKSAAQRAMDLNQAYADWYYIVPEPTIIGLRPDLNVDTAAAEKTDATADVEVETDAEVEIEKADAEDAETEAEEVEDQKND